MPENPFEGPGRAEPNPFQGPVVTDNPFLGPAVQTESAQIRPQTLWEQFAGGVPRAWLQAAKSGIQGIPALGALAGSALLSVPEAMEETAVGRAIEGVSGRLAGYAEQQRELEQARQWQLGQAAKQLGPVPAGALRATAYVPEAVPGAALGVARAGMGLAVRGALRRAEADMADEILEQAPRAVLDLETIGPAAREAGRMADEIGEVISRSADDVVTGLKRLDPAVTPEAATAAREVKRSLDTPMGARQARDLARVETDTSEAALVSAKHKLVSSKSYDDTLAAKALMVDKKRFPRKSVRQDMVGLLQRTGNARVGPKDTYDDVLRRMRESGYLEDGLRYIEDWKIEGGKLLDELNSLRVEELGKSKINPLADYVHQRWDWSAEQSARFSDYVRSLEPVERKRVFRTVFEGMHSQRAKELAEKGIIPKNLKPKFDELPQMVSDTREAYSRALATKRFLADLSKIQRDHGGRFMVRGAEEAGKAENLAGLKSGSYKPLNSPAIRELIPGSGGVYVHPELYRFLENTIIPIKAGAMSTFTAAFKNIHFLMSFFHRGALWESNIHALGPIRGVIQSARAGFGIPGLSHAVSKTRFGRVGRESIAEDLFVRGETGRAARELDTGRPWVKVESDEIGRAVPGEGDIYVDSLVGDQVNSMLRNASLPKDVQSIYDNLAGARVMAYGLEAGRPFADTMLPLYDRAVEDLAKWASTRAGKVGRSTAATIRGFQSWKRWMDASLWDHLHHPSKIYAGNHLLDMALAAKRGEAGFMPLAKIAGLSRKKLAGMTDNDIGRAVMKYVNDEFGGQNWALHTGAVMRHLSRPDVQRALRNTYISPDWNISSFRATWSPASKDPIRRWLGMRHWFNAYFGVYNYANILNKTFSGHYMWENEPGKKGHIDTGEPGPGRYIRIEKQEADAFRPFKDPYGTLVNKMRPELVALTELIAKGQKPWTRPGLMEALSIAQRGAEPFAQSAVERGGAIGLVFPVSGGLRPVERELKSGGVVQRASPQAVEMLDKALDKEDFKRVQEIEKALLDNGLDPVEVQNTIDRAWNRYFERLDESEE